MATYTLTLSKDVYTLTNTGGIDITYTLKQLTDCYNYTDKTTGTLTPAQSIVITLSVDGQYNLEITDSSQVVNTETIYNYTNLLASYVNDVALSVCNCSFECTSSLSDCALNLVTYNKMLAYVSFNYSKYSTAIGQISEEIKCLLYNPVQCLLDAEKVLGISEAPLLTKQLISLYYLAFYFTDIKLADTDTEEIDYIKTKYSYTVISPCIAQLGIDIAALEAIITA